MMNARTRRALWLATALLALVPWTATAEPAPPPAIGEDDALYRCKDRTAPVAINFKPELEVKELLAWVTGFTCKRFVLDPRVVLAGKKVTVIAPGTLSPREAYRVFLVALSTIDLTVVPKDGLLRVTDAGKARRDTVPLYQHGAPGGDQVVRYLLRPTYAQPETLAQTFALLKSDIGEVQQVGTMLLMTDYAGNIREMVSIAKLVDVPTGSDGIYTIPVQHANATKLADKIGGILGLATAATTPVAPSKTGATGAPAPSKILVDDRTNTLILASGEAGYQRVRALVERLDIPLDIEGGAAIHVYRLGSAIAEELAKTLNEAVGNAPARTPDRAGGPPVPPTPADALGTAVVGQVRVIADAPTNSLVVMSSGRDFLAIKEVIAQLDVPRRQVFIEALILEVSVDDDLSLAASAHGGVPLGDALLLGGTQMPELKSLDPKSLGATGLLGALFSEGTRTLFGKSIPSYSILFRALAGHRRTNVLSAPTLIALDNAEAKSKNGTNIPFKRGLSFGGLAGGDSPAGSINANIDRKDLLLELDVKPHISVDGTILLEIKHESNDFGGRDTELGEPIWNTRSYETRVVVKDQQSVVIGGLLQEREERTESKVPILGDIPLLGHLFKQSAKAKRKSNLVILITPYIIHDQMDLQMLRERKLREHDEFVRSLRTLDGMKYQPKLDYRRKRGLVEEIHRTLQAVDDDRAARAALHPPPAIPAGPVGP